MCVCVCAVVYVQVHMCIISMCVCVHVYKWQLSRTRLVCLLPPPQAAQKSGEEGCKTCWNALLSPVAEVLVHRHAVYSGIDELQRAAV